MKILPVTVLAVSALVLGACATGIPVGNNLVIAHPKTPATHGDTPVIVRAYAFDAERVNHQGDEIAGADCTVVSQHFSAHVRTPASLTVPLYGIATPTIQIKCSKGGQGSGALVLQPFNKTQNTMMAAGAQGGVIGLVLMGAIAASSDARNHEFSYPQEIQVTLRPQ